jgi:zinc D-Ala-D-Ala carboxypeptidase
MKKALLVLLSASLFLGAGFLSLPSFQEFLSRQLASVIGIDIESVYAYHQGHGFNRELAMGDSGEDVRLVQKALTELHEEFPEENVTGYFGEQTSAALREYQEERGLPESGAVDAATREDLNQVYLEELCPKADAQGSKGEILMRVSREDALPKKFVPANLQKLPVSIRTTSIVCLKKEVIPYLKKMFAAAAGDGAYLAVTSGFRRSEIQGVILRIWTAIEGTGARESVAEPRHSEHQLGTTVDLTGAGNGYESADRAFEGTLEDRWLRAHAHEFGFIMSYPKDKVEETGYAYEPWHYRFVGVDVAKKLRKSKRTLEEYLEDGE